MFHKIFKLFIVIFLSYQSTLHSKSTSFDNFNSKDLSNYFSGIVAFENANNPDALKFFNFSKTLLKKHDPYLKRYINTLVLEQKVSKAIEIVKKYKNQKNTNFFDAYLLLILENIKKK